MHSRWRASYELLGALRDVRNTARSLDPARVEPVAMARLEGAIVNAAREIDGTLAVPGSEGMLLAACEAVVTAQEAVAEASPIAAGAADRPGPSAEGRRQEVRALFERVNGLSK